MSDWDAWAVLAFLSGASFVIGASFTFGVVSVCKWLEWAPINFVSQLNDYRTRKDDDYIIVRPATTDRKGTVQ